MFHCHKVWSLHPQAKGKGQGWHKCRASARTHQWILIFSLLFLVQLTSFSSSKLTHQIDNVLENCIVISRGLDSSRTVIDNSTNPPSWDYWWVAQAPWWGSPPFQSGLRVSLNSPLSSVFSLFVCVSLLGLSFDSPAHVYNLVSVSMCVCFDKTPNSSQPSCSTVLLFVFRFVRNYLPWWSPLYLWARPCLQFCLLPPNKAATSWLIPRPSIPTWDPKRSARVFGILHLFYSLGGGSEYWLQWNGCFFWISNNF